MFCCHYLYAYPVSMIYQVQKRTKATDIPLLSDNPHPNTTLLKTVMELSCNGNDNQQKYLSQSIAREGVKK